MHLIGLTGGIASGKSTVATLLRDVHGLPVIDADQIARDIVAPGQITLSQIVDAFGEDVLDASGALNRAAMRLRISHDRAARAVLETITHPAIRARIADHVFRLAMQGKPVTVVEAALLVETGNWQTYNALWVVSASPELQIQRLMARDGSSESEARAMLATQLPMSEKEAVATEVIRNDGSLDSLQRRVAEVVKTLHE